MCGPFQKPAQHCSHKQKQVQCRESQKTRTVRIQYQKQTFSGSVSTYQGNLSIGGRKLNVKHAIMANSEGRVNNSESSTST